MLKMNNNFTSTNNFTFGINHVGDSTILDLLQNKEGPALKRALELCFEFFKAQKMLIFEDDVKNFLYA